MSDRVYFADPETGEPVWPRSYSEREFAALGSDAVYVAWAAFSGLSAPPSDERPTPSEADRLLADPEVQRCLAPSTLDDIASCYQPSGTDSGRLTLDGETVAQLADAAGVLPEDLDADVLGAYFAELAETAGSGGWQAEAKRAIEAADALHEANMRAIGATPEPRPKPSASGEDALYEQLRAAMGGTR